MLGFIIRRIIYAVPTLFAVSAIAFGIIHLSPTDYLSTLVSQLSAGGETVDKGTLDALRVRYGLDQPIYVRYLIWISGIIMNGDFGISFEYNRPVSELIFDRLGYTFLISSITLLFIWMISIPIGVYSAVKQYSVGDYLATFIGFVGLAVPNFILALVAMYVAVKYFGANVGGLYSQEWVDKPFSTGKFLDLISHIWLPVIIVGTSGLASLIRILRANLLDELYKPYVVMARAKGMSELRLLFKYPLRIALNPLISALGWVLPALVSGEVIVSVVMSLPTSGPMLLRSLISQDMYLAGSLILMISALTVIGTLISDILLAWLDPRIRYQ